MKIRLTQIDGKLPNLALMRLSHWHKSRGDEVHFSSSLTRERDEQGSYDIVYGSSIFEFSADRVAKFKSIWPGALVGGTGSGLSISLDQYLGPGNEGYDYDIYPDFRPSIGFTQRGCRLRCKFCIVPDKEGKNKGVNTIADIWRGGSNVKQLHLLDNDFFGQPDWRDRVREIKDGNFKVCLNQGINVRLIDDEAAEALASIEYRDMRFRRRRVYTAWDNLKDENIFFRGMDRLERAGIAPTKVMAYMLVGYDPTETWERIFHRFNRMTERGILPYPMVYDAKARPDLKAFQKWAVMGFYRIVPWVDFKDRRNPHFHGNQPI